MVDTLRLLKRGPTTEEPGASTTPKAEQQPASIDTVTSSQTFVGTLEALQLGALVRDQQEHDVGLGGAEPGRSLRGLPFFRLTRLRPKNGTETS
jgi:hypothetical protein